MHACAQAVQVLVTPWTAVHQAPLSMGLVRQEYWSGMGCHTAPGDLPNPGIKSPSLAFPALADGFFHHCVTWEAYI